MKQYHLWYTSTKIWQKIWEEERHVVEKIETYSSLFHLLLQNVEKKYMIQEGWNKQVDGYSSCYLFLKPYFFLS